MTDIDQSISLIYVVAEQSQHPTINRIMTSIRSHRFLAQADIRIITPTEFEKTKCFKQIEGIRRLQESYKRLREGREQATLSLVDPKLNEQAVLLFQPGPPDSRALLHEFGHCMAVKTRLGIELRTEYNRVAAELDTAIRIKYSRSLAEAIIHLPEDSWVEKQIVEYAQDEHNLGISAKNYLDNVLKLFSMSLKTVRDWDSVNQDWRRAQNALHRIRN